MSSSTSLARTRSLRKPGNNALNSNDSVLSQDSVRTTSPSRLPIKGPTTSRVAPQATSTASGGNGNGSNPTGAVPKSRPVSGIFGRALSVRQPPSNASASSTATTTTTTISRPPITTRNRPTTRPTSASGSTSATTISRPTTSSGVPSSATVPRPAPKGHSRTKSSATALTGATILRPPSQTSATVAAPGEKTRYPPSSRSLHQRKPSASAISTTSTAAAAAPTRQTRSHTESAASATTRQTQPSFSSATAQSTPTHNSHQQQQQQQQQQPRLRPAFTTLQQHYSPAKSLAPKPLTATYLAPPSPSKLPANVAASAETARLQTELLQLHLLHRDAPATTAAWRDSARDALAERFRAVARASDDVGRLETGVVERLNAAALKDWIGDVAGGGGGGGGGSTARLLGEDKVQALDAVLSNVWTLGEPGGRYARLVRRFEKWAERAAAVIEARGKGGGAAALPPGGEEELVFVSDLDAGWKEECAGLVRRLGEWRRLLAELGAAPEEEDHEPGAHGHHGARLPESSLSRVLRACGSLVRDMLAELDVMLQMERDAVEQENEWIRTMGREEEEADHDAPRAGAIWRVL